MDSLEFWLVVAYFGIAALVVGLWFVSIRISHEQTKRAAADEARTEACIHSIPQIRRFDEHVRGVNQLADVLVQNSAALTAATPKSDPTYRTRKENLTRMIDAQAKIAELAEVSVPTVSDCARRRG